MCWIHVPAPGSLELRSFGVRVFVLAWPRVPPSGSCNRSAFGFGVIDVGPCDEAAWRDEFERHRRA